MADVVKGDVAEVFRSVPSAISPYLFLLVFTVQVAIIALDNRLYCLMPSLGMLWGHGHDLCLGVVVFACYLNQRNARSAGSRVNSFRQHNPSGLAVGKWPFWSGQCAVKAKARNYALRVLI